VGLRAYYRNEPEAGSLGVRNASASSAITPDME
jgi:hypothetical protein